MSQLREWIGNGGAKIETDFRTDLERLRRYLPTELLEQLEAEQPIAQLRWVEAFVHLTATRYTVATYLPQLLHQQLLTEDLANPWLRWWEGSLLFADVSGFTALSERLSSLGREGTELLTNALNAVFTRLITVIDEAGGDLISFGGDALLAFFGEPQHALAATQAALALQEVMRDEVWSVPGLDEFSLRVHVGVEAGPIAFVSAGLPHALQLMTLGETVNRVAKAESLADRGEVVAGPELWQQLAPHATVADSLPEGFWRIHALTAAVPLPVSAHDSGSSVTDAPVSQMLDELDRFSPYLPPALLGRILLDPQQSRIEADLRPVTVLFAQVLGLERVVAALPPEQAASAIQCYVAAMQEVIEHFGGSINKLDLAEEGMKLVAVFGAPAAYEDHAERAARAALEMGEQFALCLSDMAKIVPPEMAASLSTFLNQRIGLNLGIAFAGNMGSAERKEYTVMGDAVNVAARVMSRAAWGEIWCSEAAWRAFEANIRCESRGSMALKGKSEPLPLYRVLDLQEHLAIAPPVAKGLIIGREAELTWLRDHLHVALGGAGHAIRIVGDAGVGKSRLVAALLDEAREAGARVVMVPSYSYAASSPYAACGEWLKAMCGIISGDTAEQRIAKITGRLLELGSGMDEWLPLLGDLARLDVPENRLTRGLEPQMRQQQRFLLLEAMLLKAADRGPLLAVAEDLQWADPISLNMWKQMTFALGNRPVLLAGVHRPTPNLLSGDQAAVLDLHELSPDESERMALALAGAQIAEPLLRQIVGRAGGNPLFLAELLHAVAEEGRSLGELPDSLHGLLLARIDQLDETSRAVLRVASVIGQRIPFGVLQSIQLSDQQTLVRHLARLDAQELTVLERVEPERVHAFRHALIQEVAYQSMLYARRRELHGRIGAYLERRYANELEDYLGLLAHHYRLSDRRDKAIDYLLKAGHAARGIYANEEAEQYYRWGLEALSDEGDPPSRGLFHDALGDILATVGRYDEALEQHVTVLDLPEVSATTICQAHRKRGSALEKLGQYAAALEELSQARAIAQNDPSVEPLVRALIAADVSLVHKRRGEYDLAIGAGEEGLQYLRDDTTDHDDGLIEARLHSELGGIFGMRGDYPRAQYHFERSLAVRTLIDDLPGMAISHNNLGYLWQLQGEYERALSHYETAEELARKVNLRYALVFTVLNGAWAMTGLGRYSAARVSCNAALELTSELKDRRNTAQTYNLIGIIDYRVGHYPAAVENLRRSLAISIEIGNAYQEADTNVHLALAILARRRYRQACKLARTALAQAVALGSKALEVAARCTLAEATLASGEYDTAQASAEQALADAEALHNRYYSGYARRVLGQIAAATGQPFAHWFDTSIATFSEIKDIFELGRSYAAYATALPLEHESRPALLKQARDTFNILDAQGEILRLEHMREKGTDYVTE